jgi:hypothetical protein
MKTALFVVLWASLLFAADQPKFGWKPVGSATFALNATEHKVFRIAQQGKWRFLLKADSAIYVGVASSEQIARLRYITLAEFRRFSCVDTEMLAGAVSCDLHEPNARLVVRDGRGPFTKLAGAVGSVRRTSEAETDRATKPNTITLTSYKWECLENCATSGEAVTKASQ